MSCRARFCKSEDAVKSLQFCLKLSSHLWTISCQWVSSLQSVKNVHLLKVLMRVFLSFSVHEMHRRRGRRHFCPGPQNRTSGSGEFNKQNISLQTISLPPLCLSVRVTEYNPVEAQNNPTLGNRAAQTNGQPCAEKSGTFPQHEKSAGFCPFFVFWRWAANTSN